MCLACEGAENFLRFQLMEQIARGEMPEGFTPEDLTNMGLPQPGEIEITRDPDGTVLYRQKAPARRGQNAFVCDSPGAE
ncbi:MAG TPA: hypothetical protein VGF60_20995 [Xanthobacteraceae bacterium]|jgi:hypothetical protein